MSRTLAIIPAVVGGLMGLYLISPEASWLLLHAITAGALLALAVRWAR